jgi:hypothetical protein
MAARLLTMMDMLRLRSLLSLTALAIAACSSSSSEDTPNVRAGEIKGQDTWKDGLVLNGPVSIAKDAVVTIEPGAKITCSEGASLYVDGKLVAKAAQKHAKITCPSWGGIAVDQGGSIALEGVEIENAFSAIAMLDGAAESTFSSGSINSLHPFSLNTGTKLTVTDTKITPPATPPPADQPGVSDIYGTFVGSHLDYDSGPNEGIRGQPNGDVTIEDSTFHGTANDLVSAYGAKHVKLAYSTFKGSHCGVHIQPSESFEIDHITSEDLYGITIYASGAGPNTVTASNFTGTVAWLDFQGDNGPITFDGIFTSGAQVLTGGPPPTIKTVASPIPDAKPR